MVILCKAASVQTADFIIIGFFIFVNRTAQKTPCITHGVFSHSCYGSELVSVSPAS